MRRALALAVLVCLALAGTAAAHGGGHASSAGRQAGAAVTLRACWMTAAFVALPATVLQPAFSRPLDLSRTFYGPDPLLGLWALQCDRAAWQARGSAALSCR